VRTPLALAGTDGTQSPPDRAVIEELPRPSRIRSPSDIVRLVVSLVLLIVGYAAAVALRDGVSTFQAGLLETVASFPDAARRALVGVTQVAAVAAPVAIVLVLVLRRRFRLLLAVLVAALVAALAMRLAAAVALEDAHPPAWHLTAATESWLARTSFPSSEYLAAVAAVATVAGAWASRRWRRAAVVVLVGLALLRAGTSGTLALDLLFALAAGVATGAAILLLIGGPDHSPRGSDIVASLEGAGVHLARLRQRTTDGSPIRSYRADTVAGDALHVSVRDGEDRRLDLVYRIYAAIRVRSVGEHHVFTSLRQDAEHRAFVALWAGQAGVSVPHPVAVTATGSSGVLLAEQWIDGTRLDQLSADCITDDVLRDLWSEVKTMHGQHIAHRALRAEIVMVDDDGRVWLVGLENSEIDSPAPQRAADVAEALASLALIVGAERSVDTAVAALGTEGVASALPYLQPLALSHESQRRLRRHRSLLGDLSTRVSEATGHAGRRAGTAGAGQPADPGHRPRCVRGHVGPVAEAGPRR
jgi:tRNA A-37 threonylcarbamoyl transferase component Bud32